MTLFGTITSGGVPIGSGTLRARVQRAGGGPLVVPGAFKQDQGTTYYVVSIPLETAIGAPGPSNVGAREGDTLTALELNGTPLTLGAVVPALKAGTLVRVDATSATLPEIRYMRGDCNDDRRLDVSDVVRALVLLFVSPTPPSCLESCDADGDGAVLITDPIFLFSFMFRAGAALPPPGAVCAVDPSPSGLGCAESSCND